VKAARPDGNTLFMGTIATFSLAPNSFRNPGYDPLADFTHLTEVVESVSVLVAHPRWQSLAQLLEAARARPGQLSYASWGVGSTAHLPMLELLGRANADMLHVPYNGAPPALTDTIAGRTDAMIVLLAAGRAQIEAGRVRPLGMVTGTRNDALPGVLTIAEQGFAGFQHSGWFSLQAPPGLPEPLAERIRAAMREQLADPEVQRLCAQNGLAPTLPERQGEAPMRSRITRELAQFRELMARAGLQPE
jgi:tripartite-type tricarboxylate transporter receptor subunit TctC